MRLKRRWLNGAASEARGMRTRRPLTMRPAGFNGAPILLGGGDGGLPGVEVRCEAQRTDLQADLRAVTDPTRPDTQVDTHRSTFRLVASCVRRPRQRVSVRQQAVKAARPTHLARASRTASRGTRHAKHLRHASQPLARPHEASPTCFPTPPEAPRSISDLLLDPSRGLARYLRHTFRPARGPRSISNSFSTPRALRNNRGA